VAAVCNRHAKYEMTGMAVKNAATQPFVGNRHIPKQALATRDPAC